MSAIILLTTLSQIANPISLAAKPVNQISPPAIVRPQNSSNQQEQLNQGIKLYQEEQFSEAARIFQQAATAFKTAGDGLNEALTLNYLSLANQHLGRLSDAQAATNRSLALVQNQNGSKEYLSVRAQALNTQGKLQLAQGKAQLALKTWEEATKVYQKAGDQAGVIGSQINQTQALQTLGFYRRAQDTLENLENNLNQQPNSLLKVKGLLSLGNTWRVVGNTEQSQQVLEQAQKLAQELRSPQIVAETLLSLGNTYQALANNETRQNNQAEDFTQKALQTYSQVSETAASPTIKIQAQLNKLRLLIDKKQLSEVQKLWAQLPTEFEQLPLSRQKVYARINLAQSLIKLKQTDNTNNKDTQKLSANPSWLQVAQIVKVGVEEAKTLEDNRAQAYALGTLGSLYEKTAQFSEAEKLSEQAVQLAEGISASDIAYRWRWQLGRIYKATGNSAQAKGAYKQAINHLKSLRNDIASISRDVQFSFREEVEPVYREYVNLLLEGNPTPQNLEAATEVIDSLQVAELDNFFRRACLNAQPVNINNIDQQQNTAIIYPVILPNRLAVIVSLPSQSANKSERSYKLEFPKVDNAGNFVTKEILESTVEQVSQEISRPSGGDFLAGLQNLNSWLIEQPFQSDLQNVKNLAFILDGSLRNIPMATLYDGEKFLVEKDYNLVIVPGLQLLPTTAPLTAERLERQALVAGLSKLSEARKQEYQEKFGVSFSDLSNVEDEVKQIAEKVKVSNQQKLLNDDFKKSAVRRAVKSSALPVIHLATHGLFSSQAESTFIITSDGEVNVNELRSLLRNRETNQTEVIELLVLSACQTAKGDDRAALGIAGVAIQSGARSTLATLWSVTDDEAADVMVDFYNNLINEKMPKAEALRKAQANLLQTNRHPYYWAPYVLLGNWQ
ncbi:CHAT domain-containing protein [Halotia branconii]|uniref:CHAT domain-containing protein n=1 Tax=Halotia branconii CENA392 TaxID=1539056 RepID=A0AAJ6P821_9CYAN|nr:CHAT domain-containing protein [Halotia branconii]WGV24221.1 CHAT domain-containing protein [Halotia branconii CENA392]